MTHKNVDTCGIFFSLVLMKSLSTHSKLSQSLAALAPVAMTINAAQAAIIYTSTDTGSGPLEVAYSGDVFWDFVNQTYSADSITGPYAFSAYAKGVDYIDFYPSPIDRFGVATDGNHNAILFSPGDAVSGMYSYESYGSSYTLTANVPYYIGFTFDIDDNPHYGWGLFEMKEGSFILHAFAYESIANTAIPIGPIPESGEVALMAGLAAGSAAALAARRRRKSVA